MTPTTWIYILAGFSFTGVILAFIICMMNKRELKETYSAKDPMLMEIQNLLIKVHPAAAKINLHTAGKSYTVNKKDMYLCLRNEKREYFNKNMIMYVSLHELGHVVCPSIGHTPEFYEIFDRLLNKAIALGIYNPSIPIVADYQDRCQL
jgi:hypothetical protein